jgi:ubiquinone/menaquinone biosynthesis C-methylase UbiE
MMRRAIRPDLVRLLRCPATGRALQWQDGRLTTGDGPSYAVTESGIPLLATGVMSSDGSIQEKHYDRIATIYSQNLAAPHTQEYMAYLDRLLLDVIGGSPLDTVAEICCGTGEAFHLLGTRVRYGVGVDVSTAMLERARTAHADDRLFVQGDAVRLPLADGVFDAAIMLGGVHHVNNRRQLFTEIRRILRPGGVLFWREPLDDFLPWRVARTLIYRHSATLQDETERPLRADDTRQQLEASGLRLNAWRTAGFLGYCFLMNGDVLPINRIWAHLPGARRMTRMAAALDDAALRVPGLRGAGAVVVGSALRLA